MYFEEFSDINQAIGREKEIKSMNPGRGADHSDIEIVVRQKPQPCMPTIPHLEPGMLMTTTAHG